jgi:nitrate/TMAO reductase-like tetraheme cytochrome c subunit
MLGRLWAWFWRPSARIAWGAIFIAGGLAGIIFWGGFNTYMEYTNTAQFCLSCHEMRSKPFAEYKKSVHYANASGVRAICSDCHVPKDWTAKLIRKIKATNELYHKLVGTIDTPEKFEARRLALAERVWATMKATDSRECRNGHSYQAMDFHKQSRRSAQKMQEGLKEGKTCIDCHKGIAHKLPKGLEEED